MSSGAPEPLRVEPPREWERLELVVRRLLDDLDGWRRRALAAEARIRQLEATLAEVASGSLDPRALNDELESARAENLDLRRRLEAARAGVDKIMGRLEFLSEAQ